jgi:hypothetical protein
MCDMTPEGRAVLSFQHVGSFGNAKSRAFVR